jgi:hypothetical protein
MLWLVAIALLFSTTNSRFIMPSPEEIHRKYLLDFLGNFDRSFLYPKEPIFNRQDFQDFPVIETTFGEDQFFYQCGPEDIGNIPDVSYWPYSQVHCSKCMEAMRSHRKTYTHQGPFILSYKCVKISHILEHAKCNFYI